MYIVAIGWLYVTVLMALTETSAVAGVLTLIFYGLVPVSLLLWLGGGKARRQRQRYREETNARLLADQRARQGDGADAKADQ